MFDRTRDRTRAKIVNIGSVVIGGYNEIAIQTMTKTKTSDVEATVKQINECVANKADLVRVAVLDLKDAEAIKEIVKQVKCPIIADIHYNYQFAIKAIENGAAKVRINPGNIGSKENVKEIIETAKKYNAAIRIGINAGSLQLDPNGSVSLQLVQCAKDWVKFFEKNGFENLVVSIKHSNPNITCKANEELAKWCKYPIHLGVTEAGPVKDALIKSCVGLIPLLNKGIGNTIRISINGSCKDEIYAARRLLSSMGFNIPMYNIIACPLCGRNLYNTNKWVEEIEKFLQPLNLPITIGIMGCVVNGPGEAKDCDLAICVKNKDVSSLYINKEFVKDIDNKDVIETLKKEIMNKYGNKNN